MRYFHSHINGEALNYPPGKAVCIGRNYVDHIKELNNQILKRPLLFIKPNTAFCDMEPVFSIPTDSGQCHHELEISVLIGKPITNRQSNVLDSVWGLGLALDLTLRDLQNDLKAKGQPWEIAKGFDNACPLTPFIPFSEFQDLKNVTFQLFVNEEIRQDGDTSMMLTSIEALLQYTVQHFTLLPGDVVLTGTPAGVDALKPGDQLGLNLDHRFKFQTQVRS